MPALETVLCPLHRKHLPSRVALACTAAVAVASCPLNILQQLRHATSHEALTMTYSPPYYVIITTAMLQLILERIMQHLQARYREQYHGVVLAQEVDALLGDLNNKCWISRRIGSFVKYLFKLSRLLSNFPKTSLHTSKIVFTFFSKAGFIANSFTPNSAKR